MHIPSPGLYVSNLLEFIAQKGVPTGYGYKLKKALKMAKMCTVSRLERQVATLRLLHAPTAPLKSLRF